MTETKYYTAELMVYFEKHHFLEIIRVLIVRCGIDRPLCLKHYLRRNIREIANSVLTKNTIVHVPSQFDVGRFAKSCFTNYNIPIIEYNLKGKRVTPAKLNEILRKFEKFCRQNGIHKKHKIYLNFPKNFDQVIQIENCKSPPTNFIHVTASDPVGLDFKDVLDFYSCTMKEIPDRCAGDDKYAEEAVVPEIMYKIKNSPVTKLYDIDDHFVNRIVMIGRRGSGRETQAKFLAARYNLVYINIESLIQQTLQSKDNMSKVLCIAYKKEKKFSSSAVMAVLWKRLLQNDTLSRGWVIVGFPNCAAELKTFIDKFQTPPNAIVVIHCSKTIALQRMVKQWERAKCPIRNNVNTCRYMDEEYAKYDNNISELYKYLKKCKTKTIHVDGTCCISYIKNKIFALLERRMK